MVNIIRGVIQVKGNVIIHMFIMKYWWYFRWFWQRTLIFLGRIGGGSFFPEIDVRCSDIEDCVYFLGSPEI